MIRRGISLVETLIGITIIGLMFLTVANIFIASHQFQSDEQKRIVVGEQATRLFSGLDEMLRQGKTVLPSATVNATLYTSNDSTLVFTLPARLSDGSLSSDDAEVDTVVVRLDTSLVNNTRLELILSPHANSTRLASDLFLAEKVKDLYIRYTSSVPSTADALSLTVSIEQTANNRPYRQTTILYAAFRNRS